MPAAIAQAFAGVTEAGARRRGRRSWLRGMLCLPAAPRCVSPARRDPANRGDQGEDLRLVGGDFDE